MSSAKGSGSLYRGLVVLTTALWSTPLRGAPDSVAAEPANSASLPSARPPIPPPAPSSTPRPRRELDTETPAPHPSPAARLHDGFYARLGLGASYGRAFVQTDRVSLPDVTVTGIGPGADLWLGWSLAPGLVLGPALSLLGAATGSAKIDTLESERSGNASGTLLGAFLDAYPAPEDGYHFGGVLSFARLQQETDAEEDRDYSGGGLGLFVFLGYDAWVAPEWSLGGMLRLGGVVTRSKDVINELDVTRQGTLYGAALLFSVVYH